MKRKRVFSPAPPLGFCKHCGNTRPVHVVIGKRFYCQAPQSTLGASYYWLKALWWFLLVLNFPFYIVARVAEVADDFTFAPAYRVVGLLRARLKAVEKANRRPNP